MTFLHQRESFAECRYIFTADSKVCISGTRFILNEEEIKMKLKLKEEAEQTYKEIKERK
jgi:hypothetical protein